MALPISPYATGGQADVIGVPALIQQHLVKRGVFTCATGIRPFGLGYPVLADPFFDPAITLEDQAWAGSVAWHGGDLLVIEVYAIYVWAMSGTVTGPPPQCSFADRGVVGSQPYGTVAPLAGILLPRSAVIGLPAQICAGNGQTLDPCNLVATEQYDIAQLYVACLAGAPRRHLRNAERPYYAVALATAYPGNPTGTQRGVEAAISAAGLSPMLRHGQAMPTLSGGPGAPVHFPRGA